MLVVEPFECRDRFALGLLGRQRAGKHRLAIHQHRAAAALGLRRAAILGRRNAEIVAQHIEQRQTDSSSGNLDVGIVAVDRQESCRRPRSSRFRNNRCHGCWPPENEATSRLLSGARA